MSKKMTLPKSSLKQVEPEPQLPASERAKNFLTPIQEKLLSELEEHKFSVSMKSKPYLMQEQKKDLQVLKLKKLSQKKQQIKKKLTAIESKEHKIEEQLNLKQLMRDRNYSTIRPKSQLSKEDILKLKKLKEQQKSFERELEEKSKLFSEKELQYKMEEKELEAKRNEQKNEKKRKEIEKRLEEMEEKRNFRHMKYEDEKKELAKLKVQKKMYEEVSKNYERSEEEEKMKKIEEFENRLKERNIDLNSLKEHEEKYEQIMKEKKQQLTKKRFELSRLHRSSLNSNYKSKFYTIILEAEQKAKRQEDQKKSHTKQVAGRMRDYSEVVKNNYAPKMKTKEDEDEDYQKQSKAARTIVDPEEMRRMGLHNLQASKALISKKKRNINIFEELEASAAKNRYKDYLTETRINRESSPKAGKQKFSKSFKNDMREVKKIVNESKCSEMQKVEKIKLMAQKIESTHNNLHADGMLLKIAAKIELLDALK